MGKTVSGRFRSQEVKSKDPNNVIVSVLCFPFYSPPTYCFT